jgi:hypothetical protein
MSQGVQKTKKNSGYIKKITYAVYVYTYIIYIHMYIYIYIEREREKYYSAIKKNAIRSFAGKWMELDIIMLCEINQALKSQISCVLIHSGNKT